MAHKGKASSDGTVVDTEARPDQGEPSPIIGRTAEDKGGQMKVCPKCGKLFKSGGLAGHLFYVHGIKDQELKEMFSSAEVDQFSRAEEVLILMKKFRRIKEQRKEVESLEGTMSERALSQLSTSIDQAQDYILKGLAEKGVFLTEEEEADSSGKLRIRPRKERTKPESDEITDKFIEEFDSRHRPYFLGHFGVDFKKLRERGLRRFLPGEKEDPARFEYEEHYGERFKRRREDAPPDLDPEQITDEQIRQSKEMLVRDGGDIKYLLHLRDQGYMNVLPGEEPDNEEFELCKWEGKLYKRPRQDKS